MKLPKKKRVRQYQIMNSYLAETQNGDQTKNNIQNNLSNTDFNNKANRIQSPRSKIVLQLLGLEENKLYKLSKKEYLEQHKELKSQKVEYQDKMYDHYEKRRQDNIELAIKRYKEVIKIGNKSTKSSKGFDNDDNLKENEAIQKELEKLEQYKKQQLDEIKNMIDYEYKLNETRKKNEKRDKENKEKEEQKKLEKIKLQKLKEKLIKEKEEEKREKQKKEEEENLKKFKEQEKQKLKEK